jgi:hypothetical protein
MALCSVKHRIRFSWWSRDSSVVWRLATGWMMGVRVPAGAGNFSLTTPRPALGSTQPPIQWVPGALSLEVKRPGRETDHSLPSSAKFKNVWNYTFTPQYDFMAWCLVKHRDNFTFYLLPLLSTVSVIKLKRMRWAGGAYVGEMRNAYIILIVKRRRKRQLERCRIRWEDNTKMDF